VGDRRRLKAGDRSLPKACKRSAPDDVVRRTAGERLISHDFQNFHRPADRAMVDRPVMVIMARQHLQSCPSRNFPHRPSRSADPGELCGPTRKPSSNPSLPYRAANERRRQHDYMYSLNAANGQMTRSSTSTSRPTRIPSYPHQMRKSGASSFAQDVVITASRAEVAHRP